MFANSSFPAFGDEWSFVENDDDDDNCDGKTKGVHAVVREFLAVFSLISKMVQNCLKFKKWWNTKSHVNDKKWTKNLPDGLPNIEAHCIQPEKAHEDESHEEIADTFAG
jgi:hypothetical protein